MKKFLATILSIILILAIIPMAYAEEPNTYKVGDIVQFGSYPQSEVKDETLVAELNALAPEWDEWISYGYYSGNGEVGSMVQGDWMRYIDVEFEGEKYRGVKFTQYRPYDTYRNSSSSYTNQLNNSYITNTIYWFKFEPIDWRVLDPATGLVMCETIIDAQPYSNTIYYDSASDKFFNDSLYTNYASDYETSSIRKWLNNDFYNTAFTYSEKEKIDSTILNDDGYSASNSYTGYEELDSNLTNKIFLLSYNEGSLSNFGFDSSASTNDEARFAKGSDYAQSQGISIYEFNNKSLWILRSPGVFSTDCCFVLNYGYSVDYYYVYRSDGGIRPSLRFSDISDIGKSEHHHSYEAIVTSADCTLGGLAIYTCECGDTYTEETSATTHTFDEGESKCKICDFDKADDCSCNCHKGGIMGFFWKIINFFNKLFKSKQYCGCGAKHW